MGWWHHFMLAGVCTLLYDAQWLNIFGGSAFGVGFAWWLIGTPYRHDLRTWLSR